MEKICCDFIMVSCLGGYIGAWCQSIETSFRENRNRVERIQETLDNHSHMLKKIEEKQEEQSRILMKKVVYN